MGASSVRRAFEIKNKLGLHARAAVQVVQLATKYDAEISVTKEGQTVNGKSIIGLMMLAAAKGQEIEVAAEGSEAEQFMDALAALINRYFDEGE